MKEKEQLDIADTNALLLHPSQFTITNPASPSGAPVSRKTRFTRHRGDQDDVYAAAEVGGNKRKRKLANIDDDIGSPSRNGFSTPAERARASALEKQTAPLYSVHTLFTDKELNFQSHQAQIAARHFFTVSHKDKDGGSNTNGTKKRNGNGKEKEKDGAEDDNGEQSDSSQAESESDPLEAPGMERTTSQNVHVTRSTRNISTHTHLSGLNILSDLAEKVHTTRPALPYATLHSNTAKSGIALPPPSRLLPEELEEDLYRISQAQSQPKGFVDSKMVEDALKPVTRNRSNLAPDWPVYLDVHLVDIDPRRKKDGESEK